MVLRLQRTKAEDVSETVGDGNCKFMSSGSVINTHIAWCGRRRDVLHLDVFKSK